MSSKGWTSNTRVEFGRGSNSDSENSKNRILSFSEKSRTVAAQGFRDENIRIEVNRHVGASSRRCSSFSNRKRCAGLRFEETRDRKRRYPNKAICQRREPGLSSWLSSLLPPGGAGRSAIQITIMPEEAGTAKSAEGCACFLAVPQDRGHWHMLPARLLIDQDILRKTVSGERVR